jgi:hypothetical protein
MNTSELTAIRQRIATKTADLADIKALSREVDVLRTILRHVEWIDDGMPQKFCPSCGQLEPDGHARNCEIKLALGENS